MANYQAPHHFTPDHRGENNLGAQSAGSSHPVQHAQGVMDGTSAHPLPTQVPSASLAEETTGVGHTRVHCNATHTCATCKVTCPNNYGLEKHAAKERHKAFLCTCTTKFVRLATLNRHIAAQAGPKHRCIYCDGNKGFAREDKLIDHLRASHKFGDKAIAQFRSQARAEPKGNGLASSAVAATGTALPVSTAAGYDTAPGGMALGHAGYSAGPSAVPSGVFDGGITDFPMFSAAEIRPFGSVEDYSWLGAAENFMDFDFSGINFAEVDFTSVDGDLDMSGMGGDL
ncbi:hypothetical protein INS49_014126 [Diaporthe citri]|uniref:uncharacterized protein n=1 Tax=Diaporthe citri TaxID=83186 RepID=UPI001C80EE2E|nr:uncharacterized protein INS49_014126 [Diaporthe citri]KAG6358242.1 hypothetical protein INS49_014126 [Diaporthe citri]